MSEYLGDFESREDVIRNFSPYQWDEWYDNKLRQGIDLPEDAEIIVAAYTYEDYNGNAFVLYKHNGKLYEVNGSHCSCYGLEGQWEPEETTIEALKMRRFNFDWTYDDDCNEVDGPINLRVKEIIAAL